MKAAAFKYQEEINCTYADYLTWDDNERWEIIDGQVYNMSPAPEEGHQSISGELHRQIGNFLFGKECKVYHAPFDVRFPAGVWDNDKIIDVVQPDNLVICDRSKIDRRGCQGAPDFIIEILSPSTAYKDLKIKQTLYELNKVKEYWIIDPNNKIVIIHIFGSDGKYEKPIIHNSHGKLKVGILEGLEIDLDAVFAAPVT